MLNKILTHEQFLSKMVSPNARKKCVLSRRITVYYAFQPKTSKQNQTRLDVSSQIGIWSRYLMWCSLILSSSCCAFKRHVMISVTESLAVLKRLCTWLPVSGGSGLSDLITLDVPSLWGLRGPACDPDQGSKVTCFPPSLSALQWSTHQVLQWVCACGTETDSISL